MATELRWSATETEAIEPFRFSHNALEDSAIRFKPTETFQSTDVFVIEQEGFWNDCDPEIKLQLDLQRLNEDTGLHPEDALVSIVIRDRDLNKFLRIREWNAISPPTNPINISTHLKDFSHSERLDVCLIASRISTVAKDVNVANMRGQIVAKKVFNIRKLSQATSVPTRWVKPEDFEKSGLAKNTISFVKWKGDDLHRSPSELIEIWINEDLKEKFSILQDGGQEAKIFLHDMAASLLVEMAIPVLSSDEDEPFEPNSMLNVISREFAPATASTFAELRLLMKSNHEGPSRIRAAAQSLKNVNKLIAGL